ncbi:YegS/Rv2252/BmrU family lipid kinase [bacterium SCSIO 12643]|nr:YegS/Rv2252/BmrU family lipid kinase [bacterium SCSIO 12643]
MNHQWYFIINPVSGSGKGLSQWKQVQKELDKNNLNYSFEISDYHQHTIELVKQQYQKGIRNFIGVGGDGTINEMVNAVMSVENPDQDVVLGLIPVGTGNDWVRNFKTPLRPENIIDKITQYNLMRHDVGQLETDHDINKHYFVNVAGAGIDGQVVQNLEKLNANGKSGKMSYLSSAIKALLNFKSPISKCFIGGEIRYEGATLLLTASLGQYFGGGMHISPNAELNGNKLDFTVVQKVSNWIVFPQLYKLFTGGIESISFVNKYQNKLGQMENSKKIPVQADGEYVGAYKQIKFSVIQDAIYVLH